MRVVHVIATTAGGTGAHVGMLAAHLVDMGADVTVCGPPDTERVFGFVARGAHFVPVPIGALPHPHDLLTLRRLRRLGLRRSAQSGLDARDQRADRDRLALCDDMLAHRPRDG